MALSKQPYRGTRDFFPQQQREQNFIFKKWKQVAEKFGYEPYNGPMLEEVDLYRAKSGEELINDQIYSFHDRGERFVAIRPEMTPTLARMVAQVYQEVPKPIRWYSIPNVYRYEKPQRGRLREHWQLNVDIFDSPGNLGELELLQIIIHLFESFGAKHGDFQLHLNDRKIVDGIFNQVLKLSSDQIHRLYKIVDRSKKERPEKIKELTAQVGLDENQIKIFERYLSLTTSSETISFLQDLGLAELAQRWAGFTSRLEDMQLSTYCVYDPSIVRGLDYYTGIVFEAYDLHPENNRALCGGGAYENLLKIFDGPTVLGVGFGLGDVTMADFLRVHKLMPEFTKSETTLSLIYLDQSCEAESLTLAMKLRLMNINVVTQLGPQKLKKGFDLAEKKGSSFLAFMGESEKQAGQIVVKNLVKRDQKSFAISDVNALADWIREK